MSKYTYNNHGIISCKNGIQTDTYYLINNEVLKYIKEENDLFQNINIESVKKEISQANEKSNYSIIFYSAGEALGESIENHISFGCEDGNYYLRSTYLINEMKDKEIEQLLQKSKTDFKNITVEDIESKYPEGSCKYSIRW